MSLLLCSIGRWVILSIGILYKDLAIAECENITPVYLYPLTVLIGAGERPFRHPTVPDNEMPGSEPLGIWKRFPDTGKSLANCILSLIPGATYIRT